MSIELPDDGSFKAAEKTYYRALRQKHKTQVAIAKVSGVNRNTIRRKFKGWGWGKDWVEWGESVADPPRAPASSPSPSSSAAPPRPHEANGQPSRDFLEPDIRAKLEAMKKKKR
jgi:hypothetical protein